MSTKPRAKVKYGMPYSGTREEAKESFGNTTHGMLKGGVGLPAWHKTKKLSAADRMEISYLRAEGVPAADIAARFGIARPTVYNHSPMERPHG